MELFYSMKIISHT